MRDSGKMIFLYGGMIGVPLLMLLYIGMFFVNPNFYLIGDPFNALLLALIGIGLIALSVVGLYETFVHRRAPLSGIALKTNSIERVIKEGQHGEEGRVISVNVRRYNNAARRFDLQTYRVKEGKLQTVLGALLNIKAYADPTLSIRYSCRMGICGSCGMVVNGRPVLACETNLLNHVDGNNEITIEPMQGHPLLKDLVTDFDDFFGKHISVNPHIERHNEKDKYSDRKEYMQTRGEVEKFLPYSFCIMCGLCLDACPVVNSNPNFVGPQALSQAYRYHMDSKDQAGTKRLLDIDKVDGVWGCEFAGSCSKACPKGVDPASAIQLLKSDVMAHMLEKGENDKV